MAGFRAENRTQDHPNEKIALARLSFAAAARCLDHPLNATGAQVAAQLRRYTSAAAVMTRDKRKLLRAAKWKTELGCTKFAPNGTSMEDVTIILMTW
jgi:hypothetical protein